MKPLFLFYFIFLFPGLAFSFVNLRNASYHDSQVDFVFAEHTHFMNISRKYSSRSLHDGLFGFGWCSDLETHLEFKNKKIILKKCFHQVEFTYNRSKTILALGKKRHYDTQTSNAVISSENGIYTYNKDDETLQFNREGKLIFKQKKKLQMSLQYNDGLLTKITDNHGHLLFLHYADDLKKVVRINNLENHQAFYEYKKGRLAWVQNIWLNQYRMQYDELNNLTKMTYPDKTYKQITYDSHLDRVLSFQHRNGCIEKYSYNSVSRKQSQQKLLHAKVIKTCQGKKVASAKYGFLYRLFKDSTAYLSRLSISKGRRRVYVKLDRKTGRPVQIGNRKVRLDVSYKNGNQLILSSKDIAPIQLQMPSRRTKRKTASIKILKKKEAYSTRPLKKENSSIKEIISFFEKDWPMIYRR